MSDSADTFLTKSFYSSSGSDSREHLNKLRDSIQFKHSISSRSINAALKNPQNLKTSHVNGLIPSATSKTSDESMNHTPSAPSATSVASENVTAPQSKDASRRTLYMKNSPSMKVLEGILNEKSKGDSFAAISEEQETENDETDVDPINNEHLGHIAQDHDADSVNDKSSETADIGLKTPASDTEQSTMVPSVVDQAEKDLANSLHSASSSFKDSAHQVDLSEYLQTPKSGGQSTVNHTNVSSVSVGSFATALEEDETVEQDPTIKQASPSIGQDNRFYESPGSTMDGRGYSTNDETPVLAAPAVFQTMKSSDDIKALITSVDRKPSAANSETPANGLGDSNGKRNQSKKQAPVSNGLLNPLPLTKSHIYNPTSSIQDPHQKGTTSHRATPSLAPETPKQQVFRPRTTSEMYPITRSPSTPVQGSRLPSDSSQSTANSRQIPMKAPQSPNKHKRSNTLSDISKFTAPKKEKPSTSKEKKRFSFKALFKSKPAEIKSKSYSSPNLVEYVAPTNKEPTPELSEPKKLSKSKSNSTFMNVFKKNRSSDNLTSLTPHPDQNDHFPPQSATLNSIREIVDSPHADKRKSTAMSSEFLFPLNAKDAKEKKEFEYDDENILGNTPINRMNGNYGEEIQLIGDLLDGKLKGKSAEAFGEYITSNEGTPKTNKEIGLNSPTNFDSPLLSELIGSALLKDELLFDESQPKNTRRKSDQLIGDSLFPKHLDAHEIDSIVSLERSRSIKSIKSHKRNSFVNYDGGDENIVHYQGRLSIPSRNASMTRSNSILKNSSRNLNVNSIDNTIDKANEEGARSEVSAPVAGNSSEDILSFGDLLDFADFIDADSFSISESPKLNALALKKQEEDEVDEEPLLLSKPETKQTTVGPRSMLLDEAVVTSKLPELNGSGSTSRSFSLTDKNGQFNTSYQNGSSEQLNIGNIAQNGLEQSRNRPESPPTLLGEMERQIEHLNSPTRVPAVKTDSTSDHHLPSPSPLDTYSPDFGDVTEPTVDLDEDKDADEAGLSDATRLGQSPILENAYRTVGTSPALNKLGKFVRPISMSFRGLKPPSFGGKFKDASLRNSDSHQSFTLSMDDDTDYSGSGIGGGFGTSSDEDEDDLDDLHSGSDAFEESNSVSHDEYTYGSDKHGDKNGYHYNGTHSSVQHGESNRFSFVPPPIHGGRFSQNKFPSFSDTSANSSPKSLSSFVLKTTHFFKTGTAPKVMSPMATSHGNNVRFSSRIILYDTYNPDEYDRHPDTATCNQLTPLLAQKIKDELNCFKAEMEIHEDSQCYTHFF